MVMAPGQPAPSESAIVDGLLGLLASLYRLYGETLVAHWNVAGSDFFELHRAFGKQSERIANEVDCTAQRVRALGETISLSDPGGGGPIPATTDARALAERLLPLHEAAIEQVRALYGLAEDASDAATSAVLERVAACREKDAWMLRSWLAGPAAEPEEEPASLTPEPGEG